MKNVYELPNQAQHYDEASAWIAKLDTGLSAKEAEALRYWMAADSDNTAALFRMAKLWDKMDTMSRLADVFPHPAPRQRARASVWWAAAASLLVAVLAGLWGLSSSPRLDWVTGPGREMTSADGGVYETAVGAHSTVELSDGTRITLNTNSRVQVNFDDRQRLIVLEQGEIHVEVAHDKSRPLSVIAGGHLVQTVSTKFTIKIDSAQQIELIVTEGRVRVGVRPPLPANADVAETLVPAVSSNYTLSVAQGERVVLGSPHEEIEKLTPDDIEVRLSWRDGNLIFRGESLGNAVAEISRYTTVEFVFLNDDLEKVQVAGFFKAGDVAGFLDTLKANFDVAYERIDDETILLKAQSAQTP